MKYDVFLSYSSKDQKEVQDICSFLEARGIRCFVAYRDISNGEVRASALVEALENSKIMLCIFTDNYNLSKEVDREIEIAAEDGKPIVTFMMSDSKFQGAKRYYLERDVDLDYVRTPMLSMFILCEKILELLKGNVSVSSTLSSSPSNTVLNPEKTSGLISDLEFDPHSGTFKQKNTHHKDNDHEENGQRKYRARTSNPDFVDLGLPSKIKWATCNVGASRPEEYGEYLAWGELNPKQSYSEENCEALSYDNKELFDLRFLNIYGNIIITRDVVVKRYGGTCRIPSRKEIEELINYTTQKWTTYNCVQGALVTSRVNGNSIFLPACGRRDGFHLRYERENGCYWSSTPVKGVNTDAYCLDFFSGKFYLNSTSRHRGLCIRPIKDYDKDED